MMTTTTMDGSDSNRSSRLDATTAYLRQFPKIELHAHLNGSIRESTLFDLAKERDIQLNSDFFDTSLHQLSNSAVKATQSASIYNKRHRSLSKCFDIFTEIGKVIVDLEAIERITKEALEDFAKEGVVYLELRSTPKRLLTKRQRCGGPVEDLATKRQYCQVVIDTLINFRKKEEDRYANELKELAKSSKTSTPRLPMVASFIVAVDRSNPVEAGFENIDLAIELANEYTGVVVGVDLGGNPLKRSFLDFRECFEKARRSGLLSITLHTAEVPCTDDDQDSVAYHDALSILEFGPNRLGHALILPPTLQQKLMELRIPVETCPTSNVMTTELVEKHSGRSLVEGLKRHPQLEQWLRNKHPICICTDDPGVFNADATQEFVLSKLELIFMKCFGFLTPLTLSSPVANELIN